MAAVRLRVSSVTELESSSRRPRTDRDRRYQHASDVRTDLQRVKKVNPSPVRRSRGRIVIPCAAAALALSLAGYLYLRRPPPLTDKDTIVLAEFTNTTGDPVFNETLRQGWRCSFSNRHSSAHFEERIRRTMP